MTEYLLDTNAIIWFLDENKRLGKDIREDIEYFQHTYWYTYASILEIVHLQQRGKLNLKYTPEQIFAKLDSFFIRPLSATTAIFATLDKIPVLKIDGSEHSDMFDRYIIASAIACRLTLISADQKFPDYRQFGLKLIEL
ncbi:MAG: type II toxin-antitoxin system VapC family toxin [Bacteroidales bacterium]|nr:type II toxin-antitoxin system VapC family toxin [Bacteroidales bacterium]